MAAGLLVADDRELVPELVERAPGAVDPELETVRERRPGSPPDPHLDLLNALLRLLRDHRVHHGRVVRIDHEGQALVLGDLLPIVGVLFQGHPQQQMARQRPDEEGDQRPGVVQLPLADA